jgi:hypothetical protein
MFHYFLSILTISNKKNSNLKSCRSVLDLYFSNKRIFIWFYPKRYIFAKAIRVTWLINMLLKFYMIFNVLTTSIENSKITIFPCRDLHFLYKSIFIWHHRENIWLNFRKLVFFIPRIVFKILLKFRPKWKWKWLPKIQKQTQLKNRKPK